MINFFRKFRKQLLTQNKISKYLLYAVGEIVLVVIGILIALQINNLNEERKTQLKSIEFLGGLKIELSVDIAAFREKITEYEGVNNNVGEAIQLLKQETLEEQSEADIIGRALSSFQILTPFLKNTNRNDVLIGQGALEQLNKELNRGYLTYLDNAQTTIALFTKLGDALKMIEINQIQTKVDFDYFNIDSGGVHFDFNKIRNDREINNAFYKSVRWRKIYINGLNEQIREAERLNQLIDKELKNSR